MEHMCESAKMLFYLTAAGHNKYGQNLLPLYLSEIKILPDTDPKVHKTLVKGSFIGKKLNGNHIGVFPNMRLEQTYNSGTKGENDLDGIILNVAATTK